MDIQYKSRRTFHNCEPIDANDILGDRNRNMTTIHINRRMDTIHTTANIIDSNDITRRRNSLMVVKARHATIAVINSPMDDNMTAIVYANGLASYRS
jgi:hypothetical protein